MRITTITRQIIARERERGGERRSAKKSLFLLLAGSKRCQAEKPIHRGLNGINTVNKNKGLKIKIYYFNKKVIGV